MDAKKELENKFNREMHFIYEKAKSECDYNATRFLIMVNQHGGVQTAKKLLYSREVPDGLTKLCLLGRLDLSVEALIVRSGWGDLFSEKEIEIAKKRLEDFGYKP